MSTKKFRFTNKGIDRLPPHDKSAKSNEEEYTDADTPGLKLAVSKSGRRYFLFRYTLKGAKRGMKLGEFPAMTVEEARRAAWAARAKVDAGDDPQVARRAIMAEPTFEEFVRDDYIPWARKAKKSWDDDVSKLDHHLLPVFGSRRISSIGARDIEQYIASLLAKELKPATCNKHLFLLSAIFRKAIEYGVISANPCASVRPLLENNARQRYLTPQEVAAFLAAARRELNQVAAKYLEFLLLTGARREEGLRARWKDIDFGRGTWRIPETKSGKARQVPLNASAIALLTSLAVQSGNPYVFPGKLPGKSLNNPVKAFHRILKDAGISDLRIHDLRHSFASLAVSGGVSLYAVQHLLGHSNPKTTERYAHLSIGALQSASGRVAQAVQDASDCNGDEEAA